MLKVDFTLFPLRETTLFPICFTPRQAKVQLKFKFNHLCGLVFIITMIEIPVSSVNSVDHDKTPQKWLCTVCQLPD